MIKLILLAMHVVILTIIPLKTCTLVDPDPVPVDAPLDSLRILALGDSYTIGQSVPERDRWPIQLADSLAHYQIQVLETKIIARTGWTTSQLIQAISQADLSQKYDLVGLLIGVNNQFQNRDISVYEKEFEHLLATAIGLATNEKESVFVLSIPDYSVTPSGKIYSDTQTPEEIDQFNQINFDIAKSYNVSYYDITGLSRLAEGDPQLVARDSLHFSGEMYRQWVKQIIPDILDKINYTPTMVKQ